MIERAKISVILATYNGEKFIKEQLLSLFAQSYLPEAIIVSDDGSTDNTLSIIEQMWHPIPITIYQNEQRLGVSANFKNAIHKANPTHYLALCDQDDIWLPNKIETSIHTLLSIEDKNLPSLVYTDLQMINENGEIIYPSYFKERRLNTFKHCFSTLSYSNFVTGCTIVMNPAMASIAHTIPSCKPYLHDAWLAMIGFSMGKVGTIYEPSIWYRMHQNNVTMARYTHSNRFKRAFNHLTNLLAKNGILDIEIKLAQDFLAVFGTKIATEKKIFLTQITRLSNKPYLMRKLQFEIIMWHFWTKRF